MKFGGYQLDALKQPTLLYSFGGAQIEDLLTPLDAGKSGVRRSLSFVDPPADNLYLRIATGALKATGDREWRLNESLTIRVKEGSVPVVRGSGDQQELIVPIRLQERNRQLEVEYAW
jgi:hypothetical protein